MDLALVGNGIVAALIDRSAAIRWLCWPRLDGEPVFCSLLRPADDPELGGSWTVELEDCEATEQCYRRNTAILETTLKSRSGSVLVTDFVPRFKHYDRFFRPPMLVRRITPIEGSPRITVRVRPRADNGATLPERVIGSNHLRYLAPGLALRLVTDAPISYVAEEIPFVLSSPLDFLFGPDEALRMSLPDTAALWLDRTYEYWMEWSRYLSVPVDWQEAVIRSAITLKLCAFEETGGIVAAITTSIPEAPDTERNWDYRFCWLRDAYFVVYALNMLGATRTMEDFIRYITNVAALDAEHRLRPVYAIIPGRGITERQAEALEGYRGMGPVRIGNAAEDQAQHDIYGSVILAASQMFFDRRLPRMGDGALFERLEKLGDWAASLALEPDASLWEFRGKSAVHTYSAAMCWAACDRLADIARALGRTDRAGHWQGEADRIKAAVLREGWNEGLGSFVDTFGGAELDASLLLLSEIGIVQPQDPRFLGTVEAIEARLRHGNHMFRYRAPDEFGTPKTAFTVCTFWYINALVAIGREHEARQIFESVLACRNHVGLLSEDIAPETGELWGNFPQSYSMVGLIVSAMRLSRSWEVAFRHGWQMVEAALRD
jgi:GH15 family glucan-1,4-alpha-glucosidase